MRSASAPPRAVPRDCPVRFAHSGLPRPFEEPVRARDESLSKIGTREDRARGALARLAPGLTPSICEKSRWIAGYHATRAQGHRATWAGLAAARTFPRRGDGHADRMAACFRSQRAAASAAEQHGFRVRNSLGVRLSRDRPSAPGTRRIEWLASSVRAEGARPVTSSRRASVHLGSRRR